jgi:hypothetical protein
VAKEFAIGFVLQHVKQEKVNWVAFAMETNSDQRKSYMRRVRLWISRLADVLQAEVLDLYDDEGFMEYVEVKKERTPLVDLFHRA